ncbi:MAG: hypothetical protein HGA45_04210 [Chloroflexales bacterium]|nr:hypothetical protein [Chloroflexales bacterium]
MEPTDYRSFLVRLWREVGADGLEQWCGEVEHIQSGRTGRFTSFEALMTLLRPSAVHPPLGGGDQAMPQQAPEEAA